MGQEAADLWWKGNLETGSNNVFLPKELEKTILVMDSTNIYLEGKHTVSRKDDSWSYKENGPGQRYMVILDLQNHVCGLWRAIHRRHMMATGFWPKGSTLIAGRELLLW